MTEQWQPSRWTRAQLEERRLYAQPFLETGTKTSRELAEQTGVSASTVRSWRKRFRARGSLEATLAPGPPSRLSDEQVVALIEVFRSPPDPQQFPDQRWTCPRVREVIGLRYDVWFDVGHLSRLLHQWGFSPQKPEKRAVERDEHAITTWIEVRVPELEKK